jgi:hypothetical protein
MDGLPLARLGVHIVSTLGVTKVVGDIIAKNTVAASTLDLVRVKVGELVISSLICHHTKNYVDGQMDSALAWYANRNTAETDLSLDK